MTIVIVILLIIAATAGLALESWWVPATICLMGAAPLMFGWWAHQARKNRVLEVLLKEYDVKAISFAQGVVLDRLIEDLKETRANEYDIATNFMADEIDAMARYGMGCDLSSRAFVQRVSARAYRLTEQGKHASVSSYQSVKEAAERFRRADGGKQ